MSSIAKPLHDLLRHCLFCQQQLQAYKLSQKQTAEVFAWLDLRRRNYVDVSDFYSKFSELGESELFYIFKFLDSSRKGALTVEDLLRVVGSKSASAAGGDSVRNFGNYVKVLKASFHLVEEHKRKLGITSELLQMIFSRATQNKKDRVGLKELIVLFKESDLEVDDQLVVYLQDRIFNKVAGLTLQQFCQLFCPFTWEQEPVKPQEKPTYQTSKILEQEQYNVTSYLESKTNEKIRNSEKLNSEIDKILEKYRSPSKNGAPSYYEPSKDISPFKNTKYAVPVQQKPQRPYSKYTQFKAQVYDYKSPEKTDNQRYSKLYQQLQRKKSQQGLINYVSSSIQPHSEINKRRQELRRGSLERQKIMDGLMNKKKKFEQPETQFSRTASSFVPSYANLRIQTKENAPETRSFTYQGFRPSTPTDKISRPQPQHNFNERTNIGKLYQTTASQKVQLTRPASASKTGSSFFQRTSYGRLTGFDNHSKPELTQFYKRSLNQSQGNTGFQKENILKRAQEEATKKIEEIERRARLKVMEKRSAAGVYNRWLK